MLIEIWSDVVCPWCYIGKRHLEAALAGFEHRDAVQVVWRSFQLDPSAPRSDQPGGGEPLPHLAQLPPAADEAGRLGRQVARAVRGSRHGGQNATTGIDAGR